MAAALILLAGCWDARDVEDRALVVGLGLDRERNGQLVVSLEVTVPRGTSARPGITGNQPGQRGNQGAAEPKVVLTGRGRTVHEALAQIRDGVRFDLFLGHVRVVVVGADLARAGLQQQLEMLVQNPEIRRLIPLAVVEGRARDYLLSPVTQDATAALYLSQMLDDLVRTGRAPNVDLSRFLTDVSEPGVDPIVSVLARAAGTEGGLEWAGLGIFRDDRLLQVVPPPRAWYLMWAAGSSRRTTVFVPLRETVSGGLILDIFHVESRLHLDGGPAGRRAVIRLLLEGRVAEHGTGGIDLTQTATMHRIQARTQADLQRQVQEAVAAVRRLGADPFGIGRALRVAEPVLWRRPAAATSREAARVPATVQVLLRIRRTGLTIR